MDFNTRERTKRPVVTIAIRVIACLLVLLIGFLGMKLFSGMKKAPAEAKVEERPLQVEAAEVKRGDYPVFIRGYGETYPLGVVPVAPEVSGKIVEIHSRLEVGEVISAGELLFKVDPGEYEIFSRTGRERLKILKRNRELAKRELDRLRLLFEKNRVGTPSGVEAAEKAYLSAADTENQVLQMVETAELNLARCEVRAGFTGRVKRVSLEKGQYVSPGQEVLTLVDDSVLEINVPLDSIDARKWLRFDGEGNTSWFGGIRQVPCEIRWTEDDGGRAWRGLLHRVIRFDSNTRTLSVAVRVNRNPSPPGNKKGFPLVDGMFCSVRIPGKTMHGVIRLPRWAVSYDNAVYTVVDRRLKTVAVTVARAEGEHVYVSGGLHDGDTVITTRLIDPLENSLVTISKPTKQ